MDTIYFKIQETGIEDPEEINNHPTLKAARKYLMRLAA
jgi:hypothetical protein